MVHGTMHIVLLYNFTVQDQILHRVYYFFSRKFVKNPKKNVCCYDGYQYRDYDCYDSSTVVAVLSRCLSNVACKFSHQTKRSSRA